MLLLIISIITLLRQEVVRSQGETAGISSVTGSAPAPTDQISPTVALQQQFGGGGGGGNQQPTATATPFSANPFNATPLPVDRGGPENDIAASQPLAASRTSAQVDDFITFTAGIKNVAPYHKSIVNLCFNSTDGNFGCVWGIELDPGQTYSFQNVGRWTTGGTKNVWITWTQDSQNYYRPVGSNMVSVTIIN